MFSIWLEFLKPDLMSYDFKSLINLFDFCKVGKFPNKIVFAYHHAEEFLGISHKSYPTFDFKSYANSLFVDTYQFVEGYVFKRIQIKSL